MVDALTEDRDHGFWLDDTDDQGRVQIPHAPDHEVLFTAMQSGYVSVRGHALAVSSDEQVVKMKPSPRIQGAVRDARTGELIREFALSVLQVTGDRIITEDPIRLKEGRFDLTFDEPRAADLQLRVLALGYKPATSESIRPEGARAMEFKLEADPSFDAQALRQAIGGPDAWSLSSSRASWWTRTAGPVAKAAMSIYPPSGSGTIANAEGKFKLRCPPGGIGRPWR